MKLTLYALKRGALNQEYHSLVRIQYHHFLNSRKFHSDQEIFFNLSYEYGQENDVLNSILIFLSV